VCWLRTSDIAQHGLRVRLLGADTLHAVSTGPDGTAVAARDVTLLVDDSTSWSSWNLFAEQLARGTGARIRRISDGGITGPAFFDHVRAIGRPVLNAPKGQATRLPPGLTRRPVVTPAVIWTWSLAWRRGETRPAVLAVADALTREVGDLGIHDAGTWLPPDDPHR
jgi:hypothetical protein